MGLQEMIREVGHLPRQDYNQLLSGAHLFLGINHDAASTLILLIPGKIYEYLAIGCTPILMLSYAWAATGLIETKWYRRNAGLL